MFFKFLFSILKNFRWLLTFLILTGALFLALTQYQAIKATPFGSFLPDISMPPLQSIITTVTPSVSVSTTPSAKAAPTSQRAVIETIKGKISYLVEVARTEEERALGLMYRTTLGKYAGMLFLFENDSLGGFWMRNCEIPLDILFIDDLGVIVDIKENMRPCKEADPKQEMCATYIPKAPYRSVLEINAGSAKANGITIGQTVTISK